MTEATSVEQHVNQLPSTPTDAEVLDAYAGRADMHAFNTIVDRYEADLMRVARSLLVDMEAAQDAVQETLLRLAQRARQVARDARVANSEARVGPWLYTVLRRHCIDQLRRRKHQPRSGLEEQGLAALGWGAPEEAVVQDERAQRLWSVVATLPPLERAAVILRYQEGLDYQGIAESLGKSVNHVGVLLHRAMNHLREVPALQMEVQS
jgi:RNA polymerase sigma-70 factor (ECF subfamily)